MKCPWTVFENSVNSFYLAVLHIYAKMRGIQIDAIFVSKLCLILNSQNYCSVYYAVTDHYNARKIEKGVLEYKKKHVQCINHNSIPLSCLICRYCRALFVFSFIFNIWWVVFYHGSVLPIYFILFYLFEAFIEGYLYIFLRNHQWVDQLLY